MLLNLNQTIIIFLSLLLVGLEKRGRIKNVPLGCKL